MPLVTAAALDETAATDALLAAVEMPPPLDPGTVIFGATGAVIVGAVLPKTPEMLLNVPGVDVMPLTVGISAPGLIRLSPLMIAFTASIAKLRIGLMTARTFANKSMTTPAISPITLKAAPMTLPMIGAMTLTTSKND